MTFEELGIDAQIIKALTDLGFSEAMPVQEKVLPILLNEKTDLVALAQTGTGKTAAFGIPLIQKMNCCTKDTEILVLCPTRELCMQIAKDCTAYSKYVDGCTILPVYGGASIDVQIRALKKGVKMIIATPGRMKDLLLRKKVDISKIKYVVLDEADEMLDMGFKDDLDAILSQTPQERNTLLFSATMPKEVEEIASNYMHNAQHIQIGERNQGSNNVKHYYYLVKAKDRYLALKRIADYYPDIYAIIFCRTKIETQEVTDMLIHDGYNADSLHGDLSQAQRDHVMNRFRLKNIQMLVATDVAARGLDVRNLTHVINYDLPDETDLYVHRSGRTGRADKQGISIAIINLREKYKIRNIEKVLQKEFEKAQIPTGKEVCKKQLFNLINKVENVDVNTKEIETFLPDIMHKLDWMDKEELIKKFVSLEFNRFLEYYSKAIDLNVDEKKEEREGAKDNKGRRSTFAEGTKQGKNGKFTRLFINVGRKDKIVPQRIIGMINDFTHDRDIEIGRIDILDNFSYVEVIESKADEVIEAFEGAKVRGRNVSVEIAQSKAPNGRGRGFGRDRGSEEHSRGRNRDYQTEETKAIRRDRKNASSREKRSEDKNKRRNR
jgi:Superfamily II DNA and RNA helicases